MANKPTYGELEQRVNELEESLHGKRVEESLDEGETQYRKLADSVSGDGDPHKIIRFIQAEQISISF